MGSVINTPQQGNTLYESAPKIYPRSIGGFFGAIRWLMVWITQAVFYGVPWLQWNDRQAVLFDIEARRFHLFGLVLWPQDFILLTGLLVCSALTLFLFTAVAGRLWCGYACPQTVYTSIFLWIERVCEGDGPARRRLDHAKLSIHKFLRKFTKQCAWGAFSLWTGVTFVGYFTPIRLLLPQIASLTISPWNGFWVVFYSFATYGNAGWMREQVCKYMCPYARFQGVMLDQNTVTVSYDAARGEPRGGRSKEHGKEHEKLGDCVDCGYCVQVCPTGIDIRKGIQIECLNCGLCVDACDAMMKKMEYPTGLISYTSQSQLFCKACNRNTVQNQGEKCQSSAPNPLLRKRVFIYAALLILVVTGILTRVVTRVPVRLDVMRDRAVLSRETPEGNLENVYRLQVLNMAERSRTFDVKVDGIPQARIEGGNQVIHVDALENIMVAVDVDVPPDQLEKARTPLILTIIARDDPTVQASSQTLFYRL